ncbi:MAG: PssD/Cps14F family polysaccharide biosynthesis glycosyltransferase [Roseburia faecis]|nr:PssD/Cps14F family polysaccharide biosynthesis glycosyltransferase [Roseburia faecis]
MHGKKKKEKRIICFTASCGGHLEELSRLSEIVGKDDFLFTEKSMCHNIEWCNNVVYVSQINRKEIFFILKFIWLFMKSGYVLLKKKPDVIISTGALVTYPICFLGKICGKKIIYIESFARVDQASLTGKLMYKIADLFIVQWKELLNIYPNAIYGGGIF